MIDKKNVLGLLLYQPRNSLAVLPAQKQRTQNQDIESALQKIASFITVVSGRHPTQVCARLGRMSTRRVLKIAVVFATRFRRSASSYTLHIVLE